MSNIYNENMKLNQLGRFRFTLKFYNSVNLLIRKIFETKNSEKIVGN